MNSCIPCPIPGQWSPTQSVSADDCMVIPASVISEVCPKVPVHHFNEPRFQHCRTPYTWDDLLEEKLEPEQAERGGEGSRKGEGRGFICALGYWLTRRHYTTSWTLPYVFTPAAAPYTTHLQPVTATRLGIHCHQHSEGYKILLAKKRCFFLRNPGP